MRRIPSFRESADYWSFTNRVKKFRVRTEFSALSQLADSNHESEETESNTSEPLNSEPKSSFTGLLDFAERTFWDRP